MPDGLVHLVFQMSVEVANANVTNVINTLSAANTSLIVLHGLNAVGRPRLLDYHLPKAESSD